jgi:hypothetical protein
MLEVVLKNRPDLTHLIYKHLKDAISDLSVGRFNATFTRLVKLIAMYVCPQDDMAK